MATSIGDMAVNIVARVDRFGADLRVAANMVKRFEADASRGGAGFFDRIVPTVDLVNVFRLAAQGAQQLVGFVKEVAQRIDEAADRADQLGTTFNKLGGLNFAATISGSSPEAISSALAVMLRNLNQVGDDSKRAGLALELLKLNLDSLRAKDPVEAFVDIAEAMQELKTRGDRVAVTLALFGKQGLGILPVLEQGAAGIRKLEAEAAALGASLRGDQLDALRDTADGFTRAKTAADGFFTRIGAWLSKENGLLDIVSQSIGGLNLLWDVHTSKVKSTAEATEKLAEATSSVADSVESGLAAFEKLEALQKKAAGVFAGTRSPRERFEATRKELEELRNTIDSITGKPLIDAVTFRRAMKQAREELNKAELGGMRDLLKVAEFRQVELARTDLTGSASVLANRKQQVIDPQLATTNETLKRINETMKGLAIAGVAA